MMWQAQGPARPTEEVRLRRLSPEKVRDLRERNWMTQQEVAARMGASLFTVQRIERGEGAVRPATARALARVLKVTPDALLPEGAEEVPKEEAPPSPGALAGPEEGWHRFQEEAIPYLLHAWQRYTEAEARALDEAVERGEADLRLAKEADERDERIWGAVAPATLSRVMMTREDSGDAQEATRYEMLVVSLMEHTSSVARAYDAADRKEKGVGPTRGEEVARRRARRAKSLRASSEYGPKGGREADRKAAGAEGTPSRRT